MVFESNGDYICPRCGDKHNVKDLLYIDDSSYLKTPDLYLIYIKKLETTKSNCCYNCRTKQPPKWSIDVCTGIVNSNRYKLGKNTNYYKHQYMYVLEVIRVLKYGLVLCKDIHTDTEIKVKKKDLEEV